MSLSTRPLSLVLNPISLVLISLPSKSSTGLNPNTSGIVSLVINGTYGFVRVIDVLTVLVYSLDKVITVNLSLLAVSSQSNLNCCPIRLLLASKNLLSSTSSLDSSQVEVLSIWNLYSLYPLILPGLAVPIRVISGIVILGLVSSLSLDTSISVSILASFTLNGYFSAPSSSCTGFTEYTNSVLEFL